MENVNNFKILISSSTPKQARNPYFDINANIHVTSTNIKRKNLKRDLFFFIVHW